MNNGSSNQTPWRILVASIFLLLGGAVAFKTFDHLGPAEALYTTLIILLTHFDHHGFTDARSRAVVVFLIVSSLVLVAYLLKWFAEYMIGIGDTAKKRRMKSKIAQLKNHYIVCGLGRVGRQVAHEFKNEGVPFVALDRDPERVKEGIERGFLALNLDSTEEESLQQAEIEKAAGLIACLGEDTLNLFVTLAARSLNQNVFIVARANRHQNELKLKRAGADRVALPYQIGGYHMANMALRPNVVDYMDVISEGLHREELEVEEMLVANHSKLAGHHLGNGLSNLSISGATVIAIIGADGKKKVRPTGDEIVKAGDRLIVLGAKPDLNQASALLR